MCLPVVEWLETVYHISLIKIICNNVSQRIKILELR